jgi:rubrerythrin
MTRKETGAADGTLDLMAIQSNALEAIRDYDRYLRDAENAGLPEVAYFVRRLMEEDSARAAHCRGLLRRLGSASKAGLAPQSAGPAQ